MPRRSPFLDMTNLYNAAVEAEECAEMLVNRPEAHALFEAQPANACKGLASKTGGAFRSLGQKIKGLFRKKK